MELYILYKYIITGGESMNMYFTWLAIAWSMCVSVIHIITGGESMNMYFTWLAIAWSMCV